MNEGSKNMGKTIYEKILARCSGKKEVSPGEIVWVTPDLIACTDLDWRLGVDFFEQVGVQKVMKPEKVLAVIDHRTGQMISPEGAESNKGFREWAKKNGVTNFYDIGRGGLSVQVFAEKGHVRPGMMVLEDDTEGEACGALGAFVKGGEDIWTAMAIDEWWFKVREIVKYKVVGRFKRGVSSTDLRYKLLGDFGPTFDKFVEFVGPTIDEMNIDDRMNLCSSLYLSGSNGIIGADQKTIDYVKGRTEEPFEVVRSDTDAKYAEVQEYDVSKLEPQVVFHPSPYYAKPVGEAEGIEIDEACVGTCASGRLEDLRITAQVLRGKKVHPRVRMYITPSSQEVHLNAAREGLINVFIEAGAVICFSTCGTCGGSIGRLAEGEVCISTSTVNHPGRMGSREAKIYLANPATVAASALEGRICDPRAYL
jgi:3-isopropylmalate/(R)-2-methylmalate dehydratase large subunit